jgi:hypothetical protein
MPTAIETLYVKQPYRESNLTHTRKPCVFDLHKVVFIDQPRQLISEPSYLQGQGHTHADYQACHPLAAAIVSNHMCSQTGSCGGPCDDPKVTQDGCGRDSRIHHQKTLFWIETRPTQPFGCYRAPAP